MAKAENYHKADKKLLKQAGGRIRLLRKIAGLSIEELANLSDVNAKYLQRCETGQENFSISILYSLTKALHIPLSDFFKDIG